MYICLPPEYHFHFFYLALYNKGTFRTHLLVYYCGSKVINVEPTFGVSRVTSYMFCIDVQSTYISKVIASMQVYNLYFSFYIHHVDWRALTVLGGAPGSLKTLNLNE